MGKKVIECEYCHTLISEEDTKCPSCGANCSAAIKKYRKEQEEKAKAEKDRLMQTFGDVANAGTKSFKTAMIIIAIPFVVIPILIIVFAVTGSNNHEEFKEPENPLEQVEVKQEVVTVGYQEEAVTKDMKVTLSSYENYAFYSEHFDHYNTPEGYQKIAFHFELENLTDHDISLWGSNGITLTADDYDVEETDLKSPGKSFATVVEGRENYEDISSGTVKANSKLKGYIGFLVPKDKEKLTFKVGDYIVIELDNPAKA